MAKRTARKKATRKTASRRPTRKKATSRSAARKSTRKTTASRGKITAASGPRTKSQFITAVAEATELSKKEVAAVFDATADILKADLGKRGPGVVNIAGMMKVVKQHKPAQPRRKGINPFTKEEQWFKAKPARNVVKVRPLKSLKDLV
jgi:nucleoid DNA-binding protein